MRQPLPSQVGLEQKPQDLLKQDTGGGEFSTGGLTRQPYRGPSRVRRSDGQREYWVEGRGYVPADSLERLPVQERQAVVEARATAQQRGQMVPDLNRFEHLNRTQRTGSLGQRLGSMVFDAPEVTGDWFDGQLVGDPEVEEMRAITDRLTPRMRPAGSGTTSDFDARMYRGSLPNRSHDGPTNQEIIRGLRREAQDSQAFSEFLDWYWPQRGTTTGSQEAWQGYLQARQRQPQLTWRQHFRAPRPPGAPETPQQPRRRRYNPESGRVE